MTPERFDELMRCYLDAGMPAPKDDATLAALGFDDLDMIDIVLSIERADRRQIPDTDLEQLSTWGALKRLALHNQAAAPPSEARVRRGEQGAAP